MKYLIIIPILFLVTCKSFQPITVPGEPPECNDMYTFMKLSTEMDGIFSKDTNTATTVLTLVTMTYTKCQEARSEQKKQIKFNTCVSIVYGEKLQPKAENYKKYADFMDCLKN